MRLCIHRSRANAARWLGMAVAPVACADHLSRSRRRASAAGVH